MLHRPGAVLEGFLRFPEATQDSSRDNGYAPFLLQRFTKHTQHAEQWCYWLLFQLKAKKNLVKIFFFGCHKGKLETFAKICVAASLETLREDPTVCVCVKQADWKLFSEISRTPPASDCLPVYLPAKRRNTWPPNLLTHQQDMPFQVQPVCTLLPFM